MRALVLLLLAVLAPTGRQVSPRDFTTEAYLELVVRYSAGQHDAVAADLAAWPVRDLQKALHDLRAVLPVASRRLDVSEASLVGTAMSLHVDVARRSERAETADAFLVLGSRLAVLFPKRDDVLRFAGRWHHAAGTTMFGFSRVADALGWFEMARTLTPDDARLLLALGSAHEIEGAVLARQREADPSGAHARLRIAAQLYEAALAGDPALDEARIRLARTQWLLQDPGKAADTIADLPDRTDSAYLRYIALLVAGGVQDALGRSHDALVRYERAAASCGRCPSALMALSNARLVAGQRNAARDIVTRVVTDDHWPPPDDPWWVYQQGQWHAIDAIVERLRREVPK